MLLITLFIIKLLARIIIYKYLYLYYGNIFSHHKLTALAPNAALEKMSDLPVATLKMAILGDISRTKSEGRTC